MDSAPSFVVQIPDLSSSERRDRIHQRAGSTLDPLWSKRQQECLPVEFPRLAANVFKIALVGERHAHGHNGENMNGEINSLHWGGKRIVRAIADQERSIALMQPCHG